MLENIKMNKRQQKEIIEEVVNNLAIEELRELIINNLDNAQTRKELLNYISINHKYYLKYALEYLEIK